MNCHTITPGDMVIVMRDADLWHDTLSGSDGLLGVTRETTLAIVISIRQITKEDGWNEYSGPAHAPKSLEAWILVMCSIGYGWVFSYYVEELPKLFAGIQSRL
jgi:hypothetical protein